MPISVAPTVVVVVGVHIRPHTLLPVGWERQSPKTAPISTDPR